MTTEQPKPMKSDENGLLALKQVVKHFDISGGLLDRLRFEKGKLSTPAHHRQGGEQRELHHRPRRDLQRGG